MPAVAIAGLGVLAINLEGTTDPAGGQEGVGLALKVVPPRGGPRERVRLSLDPGEESPAIVEEVSPPQAGEEVLGVIDAEPGAAWVLP